jgi:hypothetical protein
VVAIALASTQCHCHGEEGRAEQQGEDVYIIIVNYFNVCGCYFTTKSPVTNKTSINDCQCMYNQIVRALMIVNWQINQPEHCWNEIGISQSWGGGIFMVSKNMMLFVAYLSVFLSCKMLLGHPTQNIFPTKTKKYGGNEWAGPPTLTWAIFKGFLLPHHGQLPWNLLPPMALWHPFRGNMLVPHIIGSSGCTHFVMIQAEEAALPNFYLGNF